PYGNEPIVREVADFTGFMQFLNQILEKLAGEPLTIIVKTERVAEQLKARLAESELPKELLTILPIGVSKGLEFDHVLVFDVSVTTYTSERDRRLLYTAISRAMKNLFISYTGTCSSWLN